MHERCNITKCVCEVVLLLNNTKYLKGMKFVLCVTDGFIL